MEQIIPIISEVGFPIVVTLYLLYRIEASHCPSFSIPNSKIWLAHRICRFRLQILNPFSLEKGSYNI
ncbi:YvrJ family protein [Bacillus sp. MUM 116]|uniref:YvrJ family protein n=1 Tax=Bacillus sp. MUM 116 TaxID=1678002 RepID=UPI000A8940BB